MLFFCIIWIFYLALHSVFATEQVRAAIMNNSKLSERQYRIAYNLFNFIYLLIVLIVLFKTESNNLFAPPQFLKIIGIVFAVCGLGLMVYSLKHYQLAQFIGMKETVNMKLNTTGLNKFVRHPLYAGTILFVTSICTNWPLTINWIFLILMIVYIIIGIEMEEKKLIKTFGKEYALYRERTKKLIPFVY